jgi:hypothetical protein
MHVMQKRVWGWFALVAVVFSGSAGMTQETAKKESFTAVAVVSNNLGSGTGTVLIDITRWSTEEERATLVEALRKQGPAALLDKLQDSRPTGTIRTPDSLAYDLRFAHQAPGEDGGRQIVLATDRPMGFWEASSRPRTVEYPFTVVQMQIGPDGKGKGTLSYATRIVANGRFIELENFATSPVMLTDIQARTHGE